MWSSVAQYLWEGGRAPERFVRGASLPVIEARLTHTEGDAMGGPYHAGHRPTQGEGDQHGVYPQQWLNVNMSGPAGVVGGPAAIAPAGAPAALGIAAGFGHTAYPRAMSRLPSREGRPLSRNTVVAPPTTFDGGSLGLSGRPGYGHTQPMQVQRQHLRSLSVEIPNATMQYVQYPLASLRNTRTLATPSLPDQRMNQPSYNCSQGYPTTHARDFHGNRQAHRAPPGHRGFYLGYEAQGEWEQGNATVCTHFQRKESIMMSIDSDI
ncbi:hypothetical protein M422DRAFT_48515 [Sphaerobolus stellatus SS14]|uniref:Uncharacterized protein n=1 Tax=Sphaerobolus stellatus (strain SS14) TaxID=990650 RepID=A0A0C9VJ56_SPHS4|nr:hypothetical protein M422DRAFT_48515 [Sphaerobolus stellatus SS14]